MSNPKTPWAVSAGRAVSEMRALRQRLRLAIVQQLRDSATKRCPQSCVEAMTSERLLLEAALEPLSQPGIRPKTALSAWEKDLQGSIRAAERQQAEELQRHVGTAICQVRAGEAVQPLEQVLDWNP